MGAAPAAGSYAGGTANAAHGAHGSHGSPTAAPGAAARAGAAGGNVGELIDQLSAEIQRLRVDFERFFSGALPFAPEDQRTRVQTQLRQLRNLNGGTAVDRFRIGDLEARFNSYNELFSRRLRDREEGRTRPHAAPPLAAAPARPVHDPTAGIVIGQRLDPEAVAALYNGLSGGAGDGPRFDLASFGTYLQRQAAAIRERTGCNEVQFRLSSEDGKLKLKARPARSNPQAAGGAGPARD